METACDPPGLLISDGAVAATALFGVVALLMISSGQPARRLVLGRLGIVGSLLLLPLAWLAPIPKIRLHVPIPDGLRHPSLLACEPFPGRILLMLSTMGVVVGILALVLGWIARLRWHSRTIEPSDETQDLLGNMPFDGPGPKPKVRVSARIRRPVLIGTIRPVILIPPDLEEPDQAESLRLGLLHEMAHAERLDPEFGFLGHLAASLWFYVPTLWWVRRQMRLDQEFLADRRASERFGTGSAYASSLVGMAATGADSEAANTGLATSREPGVSALFQRILMLIRCPYPVETKAPWWWVMLSFLLIGCGTVFASALAIRPQGGIHGSSGRKPTEHGAFHVSWLMIDAREPGPDGRVPAYSLLRTLPERFELVVEVSADPRDLPEIVIVGRHLGPRPLPAGTIIPPAGFHKVRIVRNGSDLQLWVADRKIAPNPRDEPLSKLLEIRPLARQPARFRNLILTW